jgi:hypothetical protein
MLGTGGQTSASGALGEPIDINPSQLADLPTTGSAGGETWPLDKLTPLVFKGSPCATLSGGRKDQHTVLAAEGDSGFADPADKATAASGVEMHIPENTGALLRGGPTGVLTLVDATGTAYAVPGEPRENVERLGYAMKDVAVLPADWILLLPAGPELTREAAGATPADSK